MPSHYLNQRWNIVNWTLGNNLKWNFNRNSNIYIQENAFENVCEMASICLGLNELTWNVYAMVAKIMGTQAQIKRTCKTHFLQKRCHYCWYLGGSVHITDMLWEKFLWILPLAIKPISCKSKASFLVQSPQHHISILPEKLIAFSPHVGQNKINEFNRKNTRNWNVDKVSPFNYYLGHYLIMQH